MASRARRLFIALVCAAALCLLAAGVRSQNESVRRLTNTPAETLSLNPTLSGDGSRVVFESSADLAAAGTGVGFHVVASATSTLASDTSGAASGAAASASGANASSAFEELAHARGPAPALSRDGTRAAFASTADPLEENRDGDSEIFFHDGSRLRQVTHTQADDPARRASQGAFQPSISADGRLIAFASDRDLAGANAVHRNADHSSEIFLFDTQTQVFTQITDAVGGQQFRDAKLSGDGSRVAFRRERQTDGGTTLSDLLIFERSSGEVFKAVEGVEGLTLAYGRAVSDDGLRVVYSARASNGASQVFLLDGRNGFVVRQLTQLGTRASDVPLDATVSGDGNRIAFATRRSVTGGNPDASVELYLYDIPSARFTKITNAPAAANAEVVSSLSDDGTLVAFSFPRVLADADAPPELANNPEIFLASIPPRAQADAGLQLFNAAVPGKPPPGGALAPGSIAVITGKNLALSAFESARQTDGSFPSSLRNVKARVAGRAAEIFYVSPAQINLQLPAGLEEGAAEVSVTNPDGFELRGSLQVRRAAPGIFTVNGSGAGEAVALDNETLRPGPFDATDERGDPRRLIIFCTGLRGASVVEVTIGSRAAKVEAVIPSPDLPGLDQLHVALSSKLKGAGVVSLVVRADGVTSNRATLNIMDSGAKPRAARVELSPESATIPVGGEMRFGVRAFDSLGEEIEKPEVIYTSEDARVASFDSDTNGLAVARAPGETNVSASVGGVRADARLRVVARTLVINEVLADPPDGPAGDSNHDGTRNGSEDEFVELVNGSTDALDVGGWTLRTLPLDGGGESVRHLFPQGSRIPAGEALVLFGGGNPDPSDPFFGGALVARVSSTSLSLTNAGLTILVRDAASNLVTQVSYGVSGDGFSGDSVNQSLTRSPDIEGGFVLHTAANGARRFSPGLRADGSFFLERAGRLTRAALTPTEQNVLAGETAQFAAQAFDQFGRALKGVAFNFESSDASVAVVESTSADAADGLVSVKVRGLSPGAVMLTASASDGASVVNAPPASLSVKARPPKVARVNVSPASPSVASQASITLNRGGSLQLTARAFDENNQPVDGAAFVWSSSAASVASVDSTGLVRAVGVGAVDITANTPDNRGSNVSGHA
nr:Ig-like domain-containing protein [Acidobacteriota bacterium]